MLSMLQAVSAKKQRFINPSGLNNKARRASSQSAPLKGPYRPMLGPMLGPMLLPFPSFTCRFAMRCSSVKAPPYHQGKQSVESSQPQVFALVLLDACQDSCRRLGREQLEQPEPCISLAHCFKVVNALKLSFCAE